MNDNKSIASKNYLNTKNGVKNKETHWEFK